MKEFISKLNDKQKDILIKISPFNDDFAELEEELSNFLQLHCFKEDDEVTEEGQVILSILDKIGDRF